MKTAALAISTLACFTTAGLSEVVLNEPFTYPDGALITVSGGLWGTHSGTIPGQVDVLAGVVNILGSETEDVNRSIAPTGFFYNSGTLTSTFDIRFTALPTAAGTYFTHYKDATTGFRGRLFALTSGAAAGSFRLGIADTTTTVVPLAFDLSLNTTYTVTLSLDVTSGRSSFSVAGIGEGATVTATDSTTPILAAAYALRQATGEGTLTFDNLVVDASVAAVPEPSAIVALISGAGVLAITRRRRVG
jgi:hypothetical protein